MNRGQPDESRPSAAFSVLCPGAVPPLLEYPPTALWELSRKWDECQRLPRGGSRGGCFGRVDKRNSSIPSLLPISLDICRTCISYVPCNLISQCKCKDLPNGERQIFKRVSFPTLISATEKNIYTIMDPLQLCRSIKIGNLYFNKIIVRCSCGDRLEFDII